MNGARVGTWTLPARGPHTFTYDEAWLHSSQFRPLSLSLPAGLGTSTLSGDAVESWFDNLLPDSDAIRRRAQARFQTASSRAFDLLAAVGRDCAGAVQLLPPDQDPWTRKPMHGASPLPVPRRKPPSCYTTTIGRGSGPWPQQKLKTAMAWFGEKGRYTKPLEITSRRVLLTAKRLGLGDAQPILNALIAQTPSVIAAVQAQLPADFPQTVAEPVFTGLQTSASQLQRELT